MTWTIFHRRGEVLRTVIDTVDARCDGVLPMELPGVREAFGDELTLLGALHLRWHTRLSGHLERAMLSQPVDPERAAVAAWLATADELPGTRIVLDHYRDEPLDEQMASVLSTAAAKEHVLLAAMAGRAGATTEATAAAGSALEERARASDRPTSAPRPTPTGHRGHGLLGRLRAGTSPPERRTPVAPSGGWPCRA